MSEQNPQRRRFRSLLVIANLTFVAGLMPVGGLYFLLPELFDKLGADNTGYRLLTAAIYAYPILLLLSLGGSWYFYRRHQYRESLLLSQLPVISGLLLIVGILIG